MNRYWVALMAAAGLSSVALAQSGPANSAGTSNSVSAANVVFQQSSTPAAAGTSASASDKGMALPSGTSILGELTKSVDAKKAKPGDPVTAKTTQDLVSNGHILIRRGTKLVGHVTEAQARTKENPESKLGIVFDRATLKDGSEVTLNAVVQALAPAPAMSTNGSDMGMPGGQPSMPRQSPMGGGTMGGPGGSTGYPGSPSGAPAGGGGQPTYPNTGTSGGSANGNQGAAAGALSSASQGVIGMKGLTLNSSASGGAQGSVISSDKENVKLDSGTQIVLRTGGPATQQ